MPEGSQYLLIKTPEPVHPSQKELATGRQVIETGHRAGVLLRVSCGLTQKQLSLTTQTHTTLEGAGRGRETHLPGRDSIITARKQGRQKCRGRGHWR